MKQGLNGGFQFEYKLINTNFIHIFKSMFYEKLKLEDKGGQGLMFFITFALLICLVIICFCIFGFCVKKCIKKMK